MNGRITDTNKNKELSSLLSCCTRLLVLFPVFLLTFSGAVVSLTTLPTNHHLPFTTFAILTHWLHWLRHDGFSALKLFLQFTGKVSKLPQCWQECWKAGWLCKRQWPSSQVWTLCRFFRLLSSQLADIISKEFLFLGKFLHAVQVLVGWFVI